MSIEVFIPGIPQPGGSKKAFVVKGRAVVTDDAKKGKPWRSVVALRGSEAMAGRPLLTGPLAVTMRFAMPRPKGHFGSGKNANKIKPSAPPYPSVKPDVLKLARSTEDALTGVVWGDDAQTVVLALSKVYDDRPGVLIQVREMAAPDDPIPAAAPTRANWPPQVGRSLEPEDCDRQPALF